jgi:hypothetical protein
MKRRRRILLLVALLLGAAVAFVLWTERSSPLQASVRFVAYTNQPDGTRVGMFVLSNASGERLQWASGTALCVTDSPSTFQIQTIVARRPEVIPPGGEMVLLVASPADGSCAWVLRCTLRRCGLQMRLSDRLRGQTSWRTWRDKLADWVQPGKSYTACESGVVER